MTAESAVVPGATVLVVDDNAANLELSYLRLQHAGFSVQLAAGAEEALRLARRNPPRVILSDVLMSELDGFGLCRRVRAEPTLQDTAVVLISAHVRDEIDQALARSVGASTIIERTPSFDDEIAVLRRVLSSERWRDPVTSSYEEHLSRNARTMARLAHEVEVSRERYRTLFEQANESVAVLSREGRILEVNQHTLHMHGRTAEQLLGHLVSEFSPPGHEAELRVAMERLTTHGSYKAVLPLLRSDGQRIYVDYSASIIHVDGETLVLSMGRDVTEQVRTSKALAETEQRYRHLVDRIPDVVWITDETFAVRFITPNVTAMGGFTPEEVIAGGSSFWSDRVHPDDRSAIEESFARMIRDGELMDIEFRWRHRNGSYLWLWNRAIGITRGERGVQFEGVVSDITEKRRLAEQLRMSQKMDAVGQLTGGIAHDFNNILAVILANTALLKDELGPTDARQEGVDDIQNAATRGVALIRQLLAFSRTQVLAPKLIDLNAVLAGTEKMLHRLIGENIDLVFSPKNQVGAVRADAGQIEQVVINLVVNARDAMPQGGRITIECSDVELDADDAVGHVPMTPGRYVMLAVSDTGCGMDAETKKRIFEPFYSTKPQGKGTGLGLSTCYGIVKQSGGFIWAYSEPGHGTVFKIYLPVAAGVVRTPVARSVQPSSHRGNETVLVIEDDGSLRVAIGRILTGYGYKVLCAADGQEALALAERHHVDIDLVLSDVVMPGHNGPDSVARLASHCRRAKTLFMSGYTDHVVLQRGLIDPATNFIQKPFAPETLAHKVRAVLDR